MCSSCGNSAKKYNGLWRCQRRTLINPKKKIYSRCNFKLSVKSESIFAASHLPISKLFLFFAYYLTLPPPRSKLLIEELEITPNTYNKWATFCREVKAAQFFLLSKLILLLKLNYYLFYRCAFCGLKKIAK